MPDPRAAVLALMDIEGVAAGVEEAREACTRLRWHEALRRRSAQAAAESRIRGARASAALDGAQLPLAVVRDRVRGVRSWPERPDPVDRIVRGAVTATMETENLRALVLKAPSQALARLHMAAASGVLAPDQVGRPRRGAERCDELVDLGEPPDPSLVLARLAGVADLLHGAGSVPVPVVAALVHAEISLIRPFVRGNALVARALERTVVVSAGLDITGVAVPEVGYLAAGGAAYLGALTAYASGTPAGVGLWLRHATAAMVTGAGEGERICQAVLAGRLSTTVTGFEPN
ncbi:MAG: hypothetical protein ACOYBY_18065 [Dermatophilaceae bacterium]